MQWQDWRSGGRGLRSAGWGGTCVGVRVRFVCGGEKRLWVTARLRGTARLRVARRPRARRRSFAQLMERIAA
eukprot:1551957-Prymnesium_polylepis.1